MYSIRPLMAVAVMLACSLMSLSASAQCIDTLSSNYYQVQNCSSVQPQFDFTDINFKCVAEGWQAAVGHQCSTPERPFLCKVEKIGVGALKYRSCNGGAFGMIRSRIAVRRADRQNGGLVYRSAQMQRVRSRPVSCY